jgi:hypothetical protein
LAQAQPAQALACLALVAAALAFGACEGRSPDERGADLDAFRRRWHEAVAERESRRLFRMLDAASQARLRTELRRIQGFDAEHRDRVVRALGGEASDLTDWTAADYFSRLWHQTLDGRRPTMRIETVGADSAYMVLELDGRGRERFRLSLEGERWVWHLPSDAVSPLRPTPPATPREPPSPAAGNTPAEASAQPVPADAPDDEAPPAQ